MAIFKFDAREHVGMIARVTNFLFMPKKKTRKWIWLILIVALLAVILTILYGEGYLNLGAFRWRFPVKRVAEAVCKQGAAKEGNYCVYTLEPIQYYVMKDGSDYIIYGPNVTKALSDNNIKLSAGNMYNGSSYSLTRPVPFANLKLGYKLKDRNGESLPAFVIDKATADTLKGVRFVEIELQGMIKLRFNTFYLPT